MCTFVCVRAVCLFVYPWSVVGVVMCVCVYVLNKSQTECLAVVWGYMSYGLISSKFCAKTPCDIIQFE